MTITRRDFVKGSLTAALVIAAPSIRASAKMGNTYRTALISSGWWERMDANV